MDVQGLQALYASIEDLGVAWRDYSLAVPGTVLSSKKKSSIQVSNDCSLPPTVKR